jgi:hypothetical protein
LTAGSRPACNERQDRKGRKGHAKSAKIFIDKGQSMKIHKDLTMKNTASLTAYDRNSRTHSPEQIAQIAASICEFGFTNPVLIDEQGGVIAGHGRVLAAQQLKLEQIPCLTLEGLTEIQKRAYVIADNKLSEMGGWNEQLLYEELEEISLQSIDFDLCGLFEELESHMEQSSRAQIGQLTKDEIQSMEDQENVEDATEAELKKHLAKKDEPGKVPIVPIYAEHHEAFIIISDNSIDEAWLRNKLGLDNPQKSYKDVKTQKANVITVQEFRKRIGS